MTESHTKVCQNCHGSFTIEPDDFAFYEKIKVPPPTWCYECRFKRRWNWRNERTFYKRKSNATGKDIIAVFASGTPFHVYEEEYWLSDKWDRLSYGQDYDFAKPFFTQFRELLERFPLPAVSNTNCVDNSYCNFDTESKNCYFSTASGWNENVSYCNRTAYSKDSLDLYIAHKVELGYEDIYAYNSYRTIFSQHCDNCVDSAFLYDCKNCSNCFGCSNLRNKQYCFFNAQLSKDEYEKRLKAVDTGSFTNIVASKEEFQRIYLNSIHRFAYITRSTNVTGDNIVDAKNSFYVFDCQDGLENSKFIMWGAYNAKDIYDGGPGVGANAELLYEATNTGISASRVFFAISVLSSHNVQYSLDCHGCENLFGCYGLRNARHCVLNKKCTKEEYEKLVPRIIAHMNEMPYVDKGGRVYRYGEFFPAELSPFAYNETISQDYFPLTKEEVLAHGYQWKDPDTKDYKITKKPADLPDHIKDVLDSITNEVVGCAHEGKCTHQCTTAFRIIHEELAFYRKMNLPLPRLCPNCRHYERLKQRNPLKPWHRTCQCKEKQSAKGKGQMAYTNTTKHFHGDEPCPNEFETSYAPERKEIIYCESCYNSEVV